MCRTSPSLLHRRTAAGPPLASVRRPFSATSTSFPAAPPAPPAAAPPPEADATAEMGTECVSVLTSVGAVSRPAEGG